MNFFKRIIHFLNLPDNYTQSKFKTSFSREKIIRNIKENGWTIQGEEQGEESWNIEASSKPQFVWGKYRLNLKITTKNQLNEIEVKIPVTNVSKIPFYTLLVISILIVPFIMYFGMLEDNTEPLFSSLIIYSIAGFMIGAGLVLLDLLYFRLFYYHFHKYKGDKLLEELQNKLAVTY